MYFKYSILFDNCLQINNASDDDAKQCKTLNSGNTKGTIEEQQVDGDDASDHTKTIPPQDQAK